MLELNYLVVSYRGVSYKGILRIVSAIKHWLPEPSWDLSYSLILPSKTDLRADFFHGHKFQNLNKFFASLSQLLKKEDNVISYGYICGILIDAFTTIKPKFMQFLENFETDFQVFLKTSWIDLVLMQTWQLGEKWIITNVIQLCKGKSYISRHGMKLTKLMHLSDNT